MMNPILIAGLIGAGAGLIKGMGDKQAQKKERQLRAEAIRQSPWTGMQVDPFQRDQSILGSTIQGGLAGASFGGMNYDALKSQPASPVGTATETQGAALTQPAQSATGPQMSPGKAGGFQFNPELYEQNQQNYEQNIADPQAMNLYQRNKRAMTPWERMVLTSNEGQYA